MLMKKIYRTKNRIPTHKIGIIGTHRGAGVTYTALMLAFYMGEVLGKKTALLECNNHHDLIRIQNAYEWSYESSYSFSFHQITCYKEVTQKKLSDILGASYETLILDFGSDFITSKEGLLRCNTKVVIGSNAQWNQQKLEEFIQANICIGENESWIFLIPCATSRSIRYLKGKHEYNFYSVPFEKEPTMLSKNVIKLFDELF